MVLLLIRALSRIVLVGQAERVAHFVHQRVGRKAFIVWVALVLVMEMFLENQSANTAGNAVVSAFCVRIAVCVLSSLEGSQAVSRPEVRGTNALPALLGFSVYLPSPVLRHV